jgi:hypothetical protein
MIMKCVKTPNGTDIVQLDNGNTLSFGKDAIIKWVHLSYCDGTGIKRGQLLPVSLNNIKREYSKSIGKQNLYILKRLIRGRIENDTLSRTKFKEVREIINSDGTD